jgi:hypothetical protein
MESVFARNRTSGCLGDPLQIGLFASTHSHCTGLNERLYALIVNAAGGENHVCASRKNFANTTTRDIALPVQKSDAPATPLTDSLRIASSFSGSSTST